MKNYSASIIPYHYYNVANIGSVCISNQSNCYLIFSCKFRLKLNAPASSVSFKPDGALVSVFIISNASTTRVPSNYPVQYLTQSQLVTPAILELFIFCPLIISQLCLGADPKLFMGGWGWWLLANILFTIFLASKLLYRG